MTYPIIALHGFLGLPSDWKRLNIPNLYAIDLNDFRWDNMQEWAEWFNKDISKNHQNPILMGYSLGGRLALHALIHSPHLWRAGVIISAHAGLDSAEEKAKRVQIDQAWAQRFLDEDWESVIHAWNNQSVFAGSCPMLKREEKNYKRSKLASLLHKCSLGYQANLTPIIEQLSTPILWMAGENDIKYASQAKRIHFSNLQSKVVIISEAGHRVPWDAPDQFSTALLNWVNINNI